MVLDKNILRSVGGVYKNDLKCIVDNLTNDDSVNSATLLSSPLLFPGWAGCFINQRIFS